MPVSQLSIVVPGRNDDYGGNFKERIFRSLDHNLDLLEKASIAYEIIFVEWNPLPVKQLLSEAVLERYRNSKAYVVENSLHKKYSLNPNMVFHEMPAKNAGIRRASNPWILSANADILMDPALVEALAKSELDYKTIYRAHRIDVDRNSSFEAMLDPENQLLSSEGKRPPVDFLGAAGDFILCHHSLWHELRGMNETARFTTRCKDWQFLLNAKTLGHKIEFLGKVYHLDHEQGFLNTSDETKNSASCFFGNNWDIELGLPYKNPESWGFYDPTETGNASEKPLVIDSTTFESSEERNRLDEKAKAALTGFRESPTSLVAQIFHTFIYAKANELSLQGSFRDDFLAVAFAGLMEASSEWEKEAYLCHDWPDDRYIQKSTTAAKYDLHLTEKRNASLELLDSTGQSVPLPVPVTRPIGQPLFDPLLLRRLLGLYLKFLHSGISKIAFYGSGSHTREIISWGIPDSIALGCVYSTDGSGTPLLDLPLLPIAEASTRLDSQIVLSSKSFETEMLETLSSIRPPGSYFAIYNDS